MSHLAKATHSIIKRTPFLCGLLLAATPVLQPVSAEAQCTQWDVGGKWDLQQSNGFTYTMELSQSGKTISGKGSYGTTTQGGVFSGGDPVVRTAEVNGNIEGDDFYVMIGTAGVYRGKVGQSGRLDGITYDANNPSSKATWFSSRAMNCAPPPAQPAQPAPAPKPIARSGRRPQPPAPALNPPFISAGQVIIQPNLPYSVVFLGWDGGPDHPNVEVFVSINEGAEVPAFSMNFAPQHPVFKQPKVPALELRLSKSNYKYLLKDAGKTLATVMVYVP